jgi:hypothetical protein
VGSNVDPGFYVFARALRIETTHNAPALIDFSLEGHDITLIERCSITEFARMTSFEGCAFSLLAPLRASFWGPTGAKVRILVRGDRQATYAGLPIPRCPRCGGIAGVTGVGACHCSPRGPFLG